MSRLYQLSIRNFRGIRELDWAVGGRTRCLVGPGDSTKTTILDAVQLALTPRWGVSLDDSDFHHGAVDAAIRIEATVGDLPAEFISEDRYGLHLRGWATNASELHEEPAAGMERVITVRLSVDASLEPTWVVVTAPERHPEPKRIPAKDRARLGVARVGAFTDRDLGWGQGSILSRLTEEAGGANALLANISRAAKAAVNPDALSDLQAVAAEAEALGRRLGVAPASSLRPHIDINAVSVSAGGLTLHDGEVPIRRAGLGSRRLLALALQFKLAERHGITLIDEVEHGLEPFRVRHLVRRLLKTAGQVIMATHSSVALGELEAENVVVVRSVGGATAVKPMADSLRRFFRKNPEAFLARKVLVCEGKTEIGLCLGLDRLWTEDGNEPFACMGVAIADGNGSEQATVAMAFAELGYDVALLGDSDEEVSPHPDTLAVAGVTVILWADNLAIEQRLAADLPLEPLLGLVKLAIDEHGLEPVRDAVAGRAGTAGKALGDDPRGWPGVVGETPFRTAFGAACKKKGWFKRVDLALPLVDEVLKPARGLLTATDLGNKLSALKAWVQGVGKAQ